MPFRVPISSPAAFAKPISGRTPIAKITISAGNTSPFANSTESADIFTTLEPRRRSTPCERISFETKVASSGSNGINT